MSTANQMFQDIYISIDVETSGKIPSVHNLLSIGAVAIINGKISADSYYSSIKYDTATIWDPDTLDWWTSTPRLKQFNELIDYTLKFGLSPDLVAETFCNWICNLKLHGNVSLIADPATFDAGFIWELIYKYTRNGQKSIDEIGRMRMLDIRTLRAACFKVPYSQANRDLVPNNPEYSITHNALDDALCQADHFIELVNRLG